LTVLLGVSASSVIVTKVILVIDVGASTANMTLVVSRRDQTIVDGRHDRCSTRPARIRALILTAAELITSAAERGGPIEFARIATLRALNRHTEHSLNPDIVKTRIGAAAS